MMLEQEEQKKTGVWIAVFAVLFVLSLCLSVYMFFINQNINNELIDAEQRLAKCYETITELRLANTDIREEVSFWEGRFVFVSTSGERYHKYGCSHIEERKCVILEFDEARVLNYKPCNDCLPDDVKINLTSIEIKEKAEELDRKLREAGFEGKTADFHKNGK